jgi:tetrahydromethanopterin S-methyltransferase subunit F
MKKFIEDFISNENKDYKFRIGKVIASSLSGFIAGFIVATIILVFIYNCI